MRSIRYSGSVGLLALAGLLGVASITLLGLYFADVRRVEHPRPSELGSTAAQASPEATAAVVAAAEVFLARPVTLRILGGGAETRREVTYSALGLEVDPEAAARIAARLRGSSPAKLARLYQEPGDDIVPVRANQERALDSLASLRDETGRAPVDARIDLDNRTVEPDQPGFSLNVYEALATLEESARFGRSEAELTGRAIPAALTKASLGDLDVSNVLGYFETKYAVGERDRNHNLKLGASKLNGFILMPGQTLSFNETVGERTERQGYRVAHVITRGEMVDGLAGGSCQVSSTLHGAAWFAGLDIVFSTPHSRPSAYITMGLDATVVYPTTDVKLRNPYDFPVVIRYVVSQGTMRVEILGKKRPYDKVVFERRITEEIPFETEEREDDTIPIGTSYTEQFGFPGYKLIRYRRFFQDGVEVKTDKWNIRYPPTTEYLRIGSNPDLTLPPPKPVKPHGPPSPGGNSFTLAQ